MNTTRTTKLLTADQLTAKLAKGAALRTRRAEVAAQLRNAR